MTIDISLIAITFAVPVSLYFFYTFHSFELAVLLGLTFIALNTYPD